MILGRSASLIQRCIGCQKAVLHAFISSSGLPIHTTNPKATKSVTRAITRSRSFHAFTVRLRPDEKHEDQIEGVSGDTHVLGLPEESFGPEAPELEETTSSHDNTAVPWYLQIEMPQYPVNPHLERQRLPKLPINPPPLLQPMLEHISTDLGLDDLTLFDLRKLDPPPALGSNLLMVIGTARSEKHLHVSADRFCRWLRTTYKLSPYADGLLGRNELKLKMKRRARRAKLMSSVGASETSVNDEGIRSGWICVNIGVIDDGLDREVLEIETAVENGFRGFGGEVGGAKVVIQMFTEEKREELDLESLWNGFLRRQERRETKIAEGQPQDTPVDESSDIPTNPNDIPNSITVFPPSFELLANSSHNQVRAYHTNARHLTTNDEDSEDPYEDDHVNAASVEPRIRMPVTRGERERMTARSLNPSPNQHAEQIRQFDDATDIIAMKALLSHLQKLPKEDAIETLGNNAFDRDSTSFLTSFFQSVPVFPTSEHWSLRMQMVMYGVGLEHYSKDDLIRLFQEMQLSAVDISAYIYRETWKTLLQRDAVRKPALLMNHFNTALEIIEDAKLRGVMAINEDDAVHVYQALAAARQSSPSPPSSDKTHDPHWQFIQTMHRYGLEIQRPISHQLILEAFADANDWAAFWRHWQGIARSMQPRGYELYALMFERMAATGHQRNCMNALTTWVSEMAREEPPVHLQNPALRGIKQCLLVAEPDIDEIAAQQPDATRGLVPLWKKCLRVQENSAYSDGFAEYPIQPQRTEPI